VPVCHFSITSTWETEMGLSGISIWQLLIILAIVAMLFGTKRLRNIGSDLGGAIAGFKNSLSNKNDETQTLSPHDKE